ncbi:MAG: hypothetical protein ABW133_14850 [Polyangiaceae bacterium]
MSGAHLRWLLALGLAAMVVPAGAQGKKSPAKFAVPGSPESASPGSREARPRRHGAPRADAAVATFPGFRLLPDGRSRIYVELTKSVSVDERRADGMLIYVIHDARVPVRNNRNALLTTHFNTPVGRARLLSVGPDLELVIDLRAAANATQKIVPADGGGARLEIDFAAGDFPPAPGMFEPVKGRGRDAEEPDPGDGASPNVAPSRGGGPAAPPAANAPAPPGNAPSGNASPPPGNAAPSAPAAPPGNAPANAPAPAPPAR